MSEVVIILIVVAVIGGVLALRLGPKAMKNRAMTTSTCGAKPHPGGTLDQSAWYIGPDLPKWGNQSPGMPTHPAPAEGGWYFDVPVGVDQPLERTPRKTIPKVDYVGFCHGPLTGKKEIRLRWRLDLDPGAEVLSVPEIQQFGRYPAHMTICLQRKGDNWSGGGRYETYRWYAVEHDVRLEAGEHELTVPLDSGWTAVSVSSDGSAPFAGNPGLKPNPTGFKQAVSDTCCLYVVFGGNEVGRSHGMRATGKARFTMLQFETR